MVFIIPKELEHIVNIDTKNRLMEMMSPEEKELYYLKITNYNGRDKWNIVAKNQKAKTILREIKKDKKIKKLINDILTITETKNLIDAFVVLDKYAI